MKASIPTLILIPTIFIFSLGKGERSPSRFNYIFPERDLCGFKNRFSTRDLEKFKELEYVKIMELGDDSFKCEHHLDDLGRITDVHCSLGDEIYHITKIEYFDTTRKIATFEYYSHESKSKFVYQYDSQSRLVGLETSEVFLEDGSTYNTAFQLQSIDEQETVLEWVDDFSEYVDGSDKRYYHLDSNNLITKITNGEKEMLDSVAIIPMDGGGYVEEYYYSRSEKLKDRWEFVRRTYLGGKRFYKNGILIKETTYHRPNYPDKGESPSVNWNTEFYYDKNGSLIKKHSDFGEYFYSYWGIDRDILAKEVYVLDTLVQVTRFEYSQAPIPERKLTWEQGIYQLLWEGRIDDAADSIGQADSLDWQFLNTAAIIAHKSTSRKRDLLKVKTWVETSIALEEHPGNLLTLSLVYYYLGKKKNALFYVDKAIQLAISRGQDTNNYEAHKRHYLTKRYRKRHK